jgi:hypothetical protein
MGCPRDGSGCYDGVVRTTSPSAVRTTISSRPCHGARSSARTTPPGPTGTSCSSSSLRTNTTASGAAKPVNVVQASTGGEPSARGRPDCEVAACPNAHGATVISGRSCGSQPRSESIVGGVQTSERFSKMTARQLRSVAHQYCRRRRFAGGKGANLHRSTRLDRAASRSDGRVLGLRAHRRRVVRGQTQPRSEAGGARVDGPMRAAKMHSEHSRLPHW